MIELVAVLCLFINNELVEHRYQDDISKCLKHKREASRNLDMNNKDLRCGVMEAIIKYNQDGSKYIEKLITEEPDK